jgi:hypothetical protein
MDSFGASTMDDNLVWSKGLMMKRSFSLVAFVFLAIQAVSVHAGTVTFGSTGNQFTMEFVAIGNPGNAADSSGTPAPVGSVAYSYAIAKFETSRDMIEKYNANFGTTNSLVITLADMTPYGGNGSNKPASGASWNEAARFVNWLNTSSGGYAAYKFTSNGVNDNIALWTTADILDYDPSNPYRSKRARFALPNYNEWYKAAYYDPTSSTYFDYPTAIGLTPTPASGGTVDNTAVYFQPGPNGPAAIDNAGGLNRYGVMALGGNIREWEESSFDLQNNNGASIRAIRGGTWFDGPGYLSSSERYNDAATTDKNLTVGFRVVMLPSGTEVPEPSTLVIASLLGLGAYLRRRK